MNEALVDSLKWPENGLLPVITQCSETGQILMQAYMNKEALIATLSEKRGVYFSRSRQALWRKGETSGHTQELVSLHTDCDKDSLLMKVTQTGAACHTGYEHCFFYAAEQGDWVDTRKEVNA